MRSHRPRDPVATSKLMRAVRRRDTGAEVMLRHALRKINRRFATHDVRLPGTPDIVFSRVRVAVFVDGDYWHGRTLLEDGIEALRAGLRTANRKFWIQKIVRNVQRDRLQGKALKSLGWRVIRLWERDILRDPHVAAKKVWQFVCSNRSSSLPRKGRPQKRNALRCVPIKIAPKTKRGRR